MSQDRRNHTRIPIVRPAKLYCPATRRYVPGVTANVSAGGVLLACPAERAPALGETICLGVSLHGSGLLKQEQLTPAVVVRVEPAFAGMRRLGVQYSEPHSALQAA